MAFLAESLSDSANKNIEFASRYVMFIYLVSGGAGLTFYLSLTYELDLLSTSAFLSTVYKRISSVSTGVGCV